MKVGIRAFGHLSYVDFIQIKLSLPPRENHIIISYDDSFSVIYAAIILCS